MRIRIRIIWGSWIRTRIRVKSWIRIRTKVKIQELLRPNEAADAHNGGVEAQNGALEGLVADSHNFDEEQEPNPDPH